MSEKKYIGNGFKGKFENQISQFINVNQLEEALNLPPNSFKNLIALHNYDKATNTFKTPALVVNEYNGQKNLQIKIETQSTKKGGISVSLNEYVPEEKPVVKETVKAEPVQEAEALPEVEDDLPF